MGLSDAECVALLQWAAPRLGLRWDGFRRVRGQVCKRIARRMAELGVGSAAAYRALLEQSEAEWVALDAACRVTISRFYRDRAVWDALRAGVLPELAARAIAERRPLRCWSAGCASGEEPYTLALALTLEVRRARPALRFEIVATDADAVLLERARRAHYRAGTLAGLPSDWVQSAFRQDGADHVLEQEFGAGIDWRVQDLRRAMPDGVFDLVLCRNLAFTYFAPALQERVGRDLVARLAPRGALILGAHEQLPASIAAVLEQTGALPLFRKP